MIVFCGLASFATAFVLKNLRRGTFNMRAAAGSLVLLGALLIARNTIPFMSSLLGWHLITEEQTLMHIHLSEVFELFLAGSIAMTASATKQK